MPVASLSSFVARTRFGTKLAGQTSQLATLVRKNGITLRAKPNISFRISILPTFTPSIHQSIHRPEFRLILGVNAFSVSSWLDEDPVDPVWMMAAPLLFALNVGRRH